MNRKILIVDDSRVIRSVIKNELEDTYEVCEAANGLEAVNIIEQKKFIPDLITLDIEMPEMGGFFVCERLYSKEFSKYFNKGNCYKVPVIFITANDNLEDRKRGFRLGAADFITKPFSTGDIKNVVDKILNPEGRLENLTALVADDSISVRTIVASALKSEGMTVLEAENGRTAFETIYSNINTIDIVITDLNAS